MKFLRVSVLSALIGMMALVLASCLWAAAPASASVATVNGNAFETLQDAVNAIESEGTIVITDDVALTQTTRNAQNSGVAVKIPAGKSITLTDDGNAHTITAPDLVGAFLVEKGATLTLSATSDAALTIQTGSFADASGILFAGSAVENHGTFNLVSGTIKGNHLAGTHVGVIIQREPGAVFSMTGGVVRDAVVDMVSYDCSPILMEAGVMNMSGGLITENTNHSFYFYGTGGAISFVVTSTNEIPVLYADFNMSGGEISHNTTDGLGGGISLGAYSNMHMTGGTITNNYADYMGGGIAATGLSEYSDYTESGNSDTGFEPTKGTLVMDGGSISNNTSRNGGGMYVNSDGVTLNAGLIEGNKAVFDQSDLAFYDVIPHVNNDGEDVGWGHGGGIYVSEQPRTLHLNITIITENTALPQGHSAMGGGLWACPTGKVDFRVTNGVAIYNNTAKTDDTADATAAGDDVTKVSLDNAYSTINLPGRMLGGGQVTWYNDGGITPSSVGSADGMHARYDAANPGEPVSIETSHENLAVKADVTPEAIARAQAEAKLIIRNNTASHGGGVATNGNIELTNLDVPDWSLSATKVWGSKIADADKTPVELFLKIGESVLDSQVANAENNWTVTFTGLPNPDSLSVSDISIIEGKRVIDETSGLSSVEEPGEWAISYGEVGKDAEHFTLTATVTNDKPAIAVADVKATKVWDDSALGESAKDVEHPTVYFKLYRAIEGGEPEAVPGAALAKLENGTTEYTWKEIDAKDASGHAYTFSVHEVDAEGNDYTPAGYKKSEDGLTVTNTAEKPKDPTPEPYTPETKTQTPSSDDTGDDTSNPDAVPNTGEGDVPVGVVLVALGAFGVALAARKRIHAED